MTSIFKKFLKYNIPFLFLAVVLSAVLNTLLLSVDNTILFFLLPGLSWSLALCIPIYKYLQDKKFSIMFFILSSFILWLLMLAAGSFLGAILIALNSIYAFPFLGAISGFCSYFIYSKLVLFIFSKSDALICFCLGYIAFLLSALTEPKGKIFVEGKTILFFYWQLLVGAGHIVAYLRKHKSFQQDKPQRTKAL